MIFSSTLTKIIDFSGNFYHIDENFINSGASIKLTQIHMMDKSVMEPETSGARTPFRVRSIRIWALGVCKGSKRRSRSAVSSADTASAGGGGHGHAWVSSTRARHLKKHGERVSMTKTPLHALQGDYNSLMDSGATTFVQPNVPSQRSKTAVTIPAHLSSNCKRKRSP